MPYRLVCKDRPEWTFPLLDGRLNVDDIIDFSQYQLFNQLSSPEKPMPTWYYVKSISTKTIHVYYGPDHGTRSIQEATVEPIYT